MPLLEARFQSSEESKHVTTRTSSQQAHSPGGWHKEKHLQLHAWAGQRAQEYPEARLPAQQCHLSDPRWLAQRVHPPRLQCLFRPGTTHYQYTHALMRNPDCLYWRKSSLLQESSCNMHTLNGPLLKGPREVAQSRDTGRTFWITGMA